MKDKILIVDDVEINRIILREILQDDYEIEEADNGFDAIELVNNISSTPAAVLLDIMMPGMNGFEVLDVMKANEHTERIPVLFITAADASTNESRGIEKGAVDYISKPFNPEVVRSRLKNHISLSRYQQELEQLVEKKTAEIVETHERTLETLASVIEYRSLESGTHIRRSSELTKFLVEKMLSKPEYHKKLVDLKFGSIIKAVALHDIGKIGIPDSVLLKPGKLTDEEFDTIKTHTTIGDSIIEHISDNLSDDEMYLLRCKEICRHHHERFDGRGYPDGLAGEDIPLAARILSVVDVYDALVNKRCYKPSFSHDEAVKILVEGKGTQFDPDIVECMVEVQDQFKKLELELGDVENL